MHEARRAPGAAHPKALGIPQEAEGGLAQRLARAQATRDQQLWRHCVAEKRVAALVSDARRTRLARASIEEGVVALGEPQRVLPRAAPRPAPVARSWRQGGAVAGHVGRGECPPRRDDAGASARREDGKRAAEQAPPRRPSRCLRMSAGRRSVTACCRLAAALRCSPAVQHAVRGPGQTTGAQADPWPHAVRRCESAQCMDAKGS